MSHVPAALEPGALQAALQALEAQVPHTPREAAPSPPAAVAYRRHGPSANLPATVTAATATTTTDNLNLHHLKSACRFQHVPTLFGRLDGGVSCCGNVYYRCYQVRSSPTFQVTYVCFRGEVPAPAAAPQLAPCRCRATSSSATSVTAPLQISIEGDKTRQGQRWQENHNVEKGQSRKKKTEHTAYTPVSIDNHLAPGARS